MKRLVSIDASGPNVLQLFKIVYTLQRSAEKFTNAAGNTHEKHSVLDVYVCVLRSSLDRNANLLCASAVFATLQSRDNFGNEQGFGIEMLSPTDADFTEWGRLTPI